MKMQHAVLVIAGLFLTTAIHAATPDKTIANLNTALAGESNASHRYELFAKQAQKEGFTQVAALFEAASKAEAIHRDTHKKAIESLGGKPVQVKLDEVVVGSTRENLLAAIKGESYERDTMYPQFLAQATVDKAKDAVRTLTFARNAEIEHAKLYQEALDNLGHNAKTDYYVCTVCGYTVKELPQKNCPSCHSAKEKFIRVAGAGAEKA